MSKAKTPAQETTLLGSSVLPALIDIGVGDPVQLGLVVANAHKASGLSADAWNAQPDADREALLEAEIGRMREENKPSSDPQTDGLAEEIKTFLAEQVRQLGEENGRQVAALREEMAGEVEKVREYVDEQLEKIHAVFDTFELDKLEALAAQLKDGGVADLAERLRVVEGRIKGLH